MEILNSNELAAPALNGQEHEDSSVFIKANTKGVSLSHLSNGCTVPVFAKDNECTIAHQEFVEATGDCAQKLFSGHTISDPEIRVSHVIKGRVPTAIGKPVRELKPDEKTIYYQRMMFVIEIPTISEVVGGNPLKLTLGGVRAYNQENLYKGKSLERFKVFIGFKNMVCTNLMVSSDGMAGELKAGSLEELKHRVMELIGGYTMQKHLKGLAALGNTGLSEKEFAHLIGRLRMYQHAPSQQLADTPLLGLTDTQLNAVVHGYYHDIYHAREDGEDLSFWKLYNLFTRANQSSYIDAFLERGVQAYDFVQMLQNSKENALPCFYWQ
ncbi:DUF3871 family protein [Eudoraea adriatica]|uniref:DUF3871 family protein n=1 Tax=Eudoraea adriatica TaxID=446681 RepID=UPI000378EDDC|nr:DUF3871 family protein [Eudoraea adriatica]